MERGECEETRAGESGRSRFTTATGQDLAANQSGAACKRCAARKPNRPHGDAVTVHQTSRASPAGASPFTRRAWAQYPLPASGWHAWLSGQKHRAASPGGIRWFESSSVLHHTAPGPGRRPPAAGPAGRRRSAVAFAIRLAAWPGLRLRPPKLTPRPQSGKMSGY